MRAPAGAGKALNLKGAALAQYERSPPQQPSGPPPTARLFRPLGNCSPGGLYTARSTCGVDFASGALNRPRRRRARVVAGTWQSRHPCIGRRQDRQFDKAFPGLY